MNIIIEDQVSGKRFLIRGHGTDFELFAEAIGKRKNQELKHFDIDLGDNGKWVSCHNYPSSLPYAVSKVLNWLLGDPDDSDVIVVEAEKAKTKIANVIKDRVGKIIAEIHNE